MSPNVRHRQHAVNLERPARTPEGQAFTDLVLDVVLLSATFTEIGEALAKPAGQTLARWVVLDAAADEPMTVAQIARIRGYARQSVQRVADVLVREGLAVYEENPEHRRARLLRPTPAGMRALVAITEAQKRWADAVGAEVGRADIATMREIVARIRGALAKHPLAED